MKPSEQLNPKDQIAATMGEIVALIFGDEPPTSMENLISRPLIALGRITQLKEYKDAMKNEDKMDELTRLIGSLPKDLDKVFIPQIHQGAYFLAYYKYLGVEKEIAQITPEKLAEIGETLYGLSWQTDLARALGVSNRAIRYWVSGSKIPHQLGVELLAMLKAKEISVKTLIQKMKDEK